MHARTHCGRTHARTPRMGDKNEGQRWKWNGKVNVGDGDKDGAGMKIWLGAATDRGDLLQTFKKSVILNKNIKKDLGLNIIAIYKRSSNILYSERKNSPEIIGSTDPSLFKNEFEKKLYKKIHDIKKYFSNIDKDENYEESLKVLFSAKNEVTAFFDNVIVNDDNPIIKRNRLELLQMLCKSFDNYLNFSKIEA